MKPLIHILFGLFCFFGFSAGAFAKNDLSGEWKGQYLCAQGLTNLTISLSPAEGSVSMFEGELYFYPHQSNPYVARGKHTIKATLLDAQGGFEISPIKWIVHPRGYTFSQLYGTIIQNGKAITGMVNNPGCKSFFAINENAENVDVIGGVPREAQGRMAIDQLHHENEKRTRSWNARRVKNQQADSTKPTRPDVESQRFSRTGFFKNEVQSGFNKICYYDVMGDIAAFTVSSAEVCPISRNF